MRSDDVSRAKKSVTGTVTLRVTRSFESLRIGEEIEHAMNPRVRALINAGLLEVLSGGESEAGPGATGQGDSGGEPEGAEAESSAGAEPGEDPRAG